MLTNPYSYTIICFVNEIQRNDKDTKMQKWRNWQTRTVQVRVVAIPCGFDSHLLHCRINGRATGVG